MGIGRIAWSRLTGLAQAVAAVGCGLVLLSVALLLVFGRAPAEFRRAEPLNPEEFASFGRQLSAAELDLAGGSARNSPGFDSLVVVLGLSTAREGFNGAELGTLLCGRPRVLNLARSGGSFRELDYYSSALRRSRLRPGLTVLAIHPAWLAGRESIRVPRVNWEDLLQSSGASRFRLASRMIAQLVWPRENQEGVRALITNSLLEIRQEVASVFGLTAQSLFPAGSESPWRDRSQYVGPRADQLQFARQLDGWTAAGWFAPGRYTAPDAEARAFANIVLSAIAISRRTIVVLMPETEALRRRVPEAARVALAHSLRSLSGSISSFDFQAAVPDSLFYDYAHVNAMGRELLTKRLAESLSPRGDCATDNGHSLGALKPLRHN